MPNAIIKNVMALLVLVVLCIVIGAQAAESRTVAAGIIVALVGGSFMIWLGPRCWILIFLVPPVMALLPLPGKLAAIPVSFLVGLVVLVYWFIMWGMGYVRFRWRGLLVLDLLVLAMLAYMLFSYVRNPVSMLIFGVDSEYVGGKEYVYCALGCLFYLTISCIPCSYEQVVRVMKWAVRLCLLACLLSLLIRLSGYVGGAADLQEDATQSRFGMFLQLGLYGIYTLYGQHPISKVFMSPVLLAGCLLSCLGILLSGWREQMLAAAFISIALAFIKRELCCLMLVFLAMYASLLYLSKEELVEELPFGGQRCVSILPGVKVSAEAEADTSHSSEWRIEMWKWALDPRTRYINDYVWGDGFGISTDFLRRETIASMRQGQHYNLREQFAVTGVWHNGAITAIHRLGGAGLAIISLIYIAGVCLMIRACRAMRGTPLYLPSLFFALPYAAQPALFYISAGTIIKFFNTFVALSMIKFFYCVAREQGWIQPWRLQQRYVPLVIREHEQSLRPAGN